MSDKINSGGAGKPPRTDAHQPALTPMEKKAAERRQRYRRRRRILHAGQTLMAVGVLVALVHLLAHWGAFGGQPSSLVDLVAGYPAGAVLFLTGAIAAGQRQ